MPLILVRRAIASSSSAGKLPRSSSPDSTSWARLRMYPDFCRDMPGGAQFLVAGGEQFLEVGRRAKGRFELGPHRPCRGNADLLTDDGPKQGLGAGLAVPRLRHAELVDDPGKGRLAVGERGQVGLDALGGANHQAVAAAYIATAAALDTLRLSMASLIGSFASASQCWRVLCRMPSPSAPSTSATRCGPSASLSSVSASPAGRSARSPPRRSRRALGPG